MDQQLLFDAEGKAPWTSPRLHPLSTARGAVADTTGAITDGASAPSSLGPS